MFSLESLWISIDSFCQTPVPNPDFSLGLGVNFVLPLSQKEEQQQESHQNIPEGNILEFLNLAKSLTKPHQTQSSFQWSTFGEKITSARKTKYWKMHTKRPMQRQTGKQVFIDALNCSTCHKNNFNTF